MFASIVGVGVCWTAMSQSVVKPGMTYAELMALLHEQPVILNREQQKVIREVEFPRAGVTVAFNESGKVKEDKEANRKAASQRALERIALALPKGFEQAAMVTLVRPDAVPDKNEKLSGFARLMAARMTSKKAAKITVGFYTEWENKLTMHDALFIHLEWFDGAWTVTKYEAGDWSSNKVSRLVAYIDGLSGNRN